jgi:hypothetical protein
VQGRERQQADAVPGERNRVMHADIEAPAGSRRNRGRTGVDMNFG